MGSHKITRKYTISKMKLGLIMGIALALIAALPVLSEEPVFAVASSGPKFSNQVDKLAESADASDSSDASDAVTEFLRGHKKKDRKASKDSRHSSRRSSKKKSSKKKKRSSRRSSKKKKKSSCKKSCKKKTKNVDCSRRCSND